MGRMGLFLLFRWTLQMWVFISEIAILLLHIYFCNSNCRKHRRRRHPSISEKDSTPTVCGLSKDQQYPTTVYHVRSWCHLLYSEEMRVLSTSSALKTLSMESKFKLLLTFLYWSYQIHLNVRNRNRCAIKNKQIHNQILNKNYNSRNKISFYVQTKLRASAKKRRKMALA